jgi:hypothetical protein
MDAPQQKSAVLENPCQNEPEKIAHTLVRIPMM